MKKTSIYYKDKKKLLKSGKKILYFYLSNRAAYAQVLDISEFQNKTVANFTNYEKGKTKTNKQYTEEFAKKVLEELKKRNLNVLRYVKYKPTKNSRKEIFLRYFINKK